MFLASQEESDLKWGTVWDTEHRGGVSWVHSQVCLCCKREPVSWSEARCRRSRESSCSGICSRTVPHHSLVLCRMTSTCLANPPSLTTCQPETPQLWGEIFVKIHHLSHVMVVALKLCSMELTIRLCLKRYVASRNKIIRSRHSPIEDFLTSLKCWCQSKTQGSWKGCNHQPSQTDHSVLCQQMVQRNFSPNDQTFRAPLP